MLTVKKSTIVFSLCFLTFALVISPMPVQGEDNSGRQAPTFTIKKVEAVPGQKATEQKNPDATEQTGSSENQPQIFLQTPDYDFGKVWEGKEVIHSFIVKNTGNAELAIKDVRTG